MAIAKSYLLTAVLGVVGAYVFQLLHIPMPWLLGPLLTILVLQLTTPLPLKWNKHFRNFGLVIGGYSIGHAFTLEALADIQLYLPVMISLNVLYIILLIFISWVIVKRVKVDQLTALTSCVPGGMTQIVTYAEEQGSKNITIITFYQVLRVLCIIGFVPLLVVGNSSSSSTSVSDAHYTLPFLLFFALSYIAGFIAMKIKIPTGYMLIRYFIYGLTTCKYRDSRKSGERTSCCTNCDGDLHRTAYEKRESSLIEKADFLCVRFVVSIYRKCVRPCSISDANLSTRL